MIKDGELITLSCKSKLFLYERDTFGIKYKNGKWSKWYILKEKRRRIMHVNSFKKIKARCNKAFWDEWPCLIAMNPE